MNRFLTIASTGLFATGLAILPISAFAQGGASTDAKPAVTAPAAKSATMTDSKAPAGGTVAKDAKAPAKTDAGKVSATTPTHPAPVKSGNGA